MSDQNEKTGIAMIKRDNDHLPNVETEPEYPSWCYRNGWSKDTSGEIRDIDIFQGVHVYNELNGKMIVCANSRVQGRGPCWIVPNGAIITKNRPKWTESKYWRVP